MTGALRGRSAADAACEKASAKPATTKDGIFFMKAPDGGDLKVELTLSAISHVNLRVFAPFLAEFKRLWQCRYTIRYLNTFAK
jgi:hypothetical protein